MTWTKEWAGVHCPHVPLLSAYCSEKREEFLGQYCNSASRTSHTGLITAHQILWSSISNKRWMFISPSTITVSRSLILKAGYGFPDRAECADCLKLCWRVIHARTQSRRDPRNGDHLASATVVIYDVSALRQAVETHIGWSNRAPSCFLLVFSDKQHAYSRRRNKCRWIFR